MGRRWFAGWEMVRPVIIIRLHFWEVSVLLMQFMENSVVIVTEFVLRQKGF